MVPGASALRTGLGVLWLIAGILQAQPAMFTMQFYIHYPGSLMDESVLQQAAASQPSWLSPWLHAGAAAWGAHAVVFNSFAVLLQLLFGIILVFPKLRRFRRTALWTSIFWGLLVWVFGEGIGRIFASGGNYFTGWPGSVALYIISAVLLLLPSRAWSNGVAGNVIRGFMGLFWFVGALLQAFGSTNFWNASGIMSIFATASFQLQPYLLSLPMQNFSIWAGNHAHVFNAFLVLAMLGLALGSVFWISHRWFLTAALLWLAWSWWFGQDFGDIFTGLSTDVNTVPVIGILTYTAWLLFRKRRVSRNAS